MRASIPAPAADRPPLASAALVAAASLAVGLGIARWTVRPAPPSAEAPPESTTSEVPPEPTELRSPDPVPPGPAEPARPTDTEAPLPAPIPSGTPGVTPPSTATATPATPEPRTRGRRRAEPALLPARGPARGTLVRGRVAYLRCEGGASGAGCARDHALEDVVWAAIASIPTCADGPAPPGQADVVMTISDDGVEIRSRDTFADEVVRLDGAQTVGCLAHLTSDPVLTTSLRRVFISFRFRIE